MSNIATLLDMISKLTEGELAVLGSILTTVKNDVATAKANSELAVLWSQFALKTKQNPNPQNLIDPNTGLPIVEPNYQTVGNYPMIFGDPTDTSVPARSISFMFGGQTFLGYVNQAQGTPYLDVNNVGNTAQELSQYEVVNYMTLMQAIQGNQINLNAIYLNKTDDVTPNGSQHTLGSVYFRGGSEKVYYGTTVADSTKEIAVQNDLTNLHNTINGLFGTLPDSATNVGQAFTFYLPLSGGTVNGNLSVTATPSADLHVVRRIDLGNLVRSLPAYNSSMEGYGLFIIGGTPTWILTSSGTGVSNTIVYNATMTVSSTNDSGYWFNVTAVVADTLNTNFTETYHGSISDGSWSTGDETTTYTSGANDYLTYVVLLCNVTGDYRFDVSNQASLIYDMGTTDPGSSIGADTVALVSNVSGSTVVGSFALTSGHYYLVGKPFVATSAFPYPTAYGSFNIVINQVTG